jgi:hypothetical protein
MVLLLFTTLVSCGFAAAVCSWFLRKSRPESAVRNVIELMPEHDQDFATVSSDLKQYEQLLRRVQRARRDAAIAYLDDLLNDFVRVQRLLNHAAKFVPDLSPADELNRFARGIWFPVEVRLVRLSVQCGWTPVARLGAMTREVSKLADWANTVLARVATGPGLPGLRADLNRLD